MPDGVKAKCPSSKSALGHRVILFELRDDGLVCFDLLTAPHISVAMATDCLPELFRLRLREPHVLIPLSLRFPVGRVIRGTCQRTPPEQIRELSDHSNLRYGSCAVLTVYAERRAVRAGNSASAHAPDPPFR